MIKHLSVCFTIHTANSHFLQLWSTAGHFSFAELIKALPGTRTLLIPARSDATPQATLMKGRICRCSCNFFWTWLFSLSAVGGVSGIQRAACRVLNKCVCLCASHSVYVSIRVCVLECVSDHIYMQIQGMHVFFGIQAFVSVQVMLHIMRVCIQMALLELW